MEQQATRPEESPKAPSPISERRPVPLRLSGQQSAMYAALREKDSGLSTMYLGALMVLSDTSNPDCLALAAHGIRELIEKLPQFLAVNIKAQKESLTVKVRELEDSWLSSCDESQRYDGKVWSGSIDAVLARFLGHVARFFEWFAAHHPRRKSEIAQTLARLDRSGRPLPELLARLNVDYWDDMRDFFVSVAHHRENVDTLVFAQWLDALERFLLDRFYPRTFEDIDLIDSIIREGESDAQT
jgi:hypothetical protein